MIYRRCGNSGLLLPAISLGMWQNFGDETPFEVQETIVRRAFDLGITHFDLANDYGVPPGSAEEHFPHHMKRSLASHRHEIVVSTKAGNRMWPGPYGEWGSRKCVLDSLDQSLRRLKLDYVDIFYVHQFDPNTPLEETMGALDWAVRSGKARHVGISSYSAQKTHEALEILRALGTPGLIHQPSYSMVDRWIEQPDPALQSKTLIDVLAEDRIGAIVFSPLAQGLLTNKYLHSVPPMSRATIDGWKSVITDENLACVRALNAIAAERGQSLAQLGLAWVLRRDVISSALVGVSSLAQLEDNLHALNNLDIDEPTLSRIDAIVQGIAVTF